MKRIPSALILASCLLGPWACDEPPSAQDTRLSLVATLGGADTAGYARALTPREFVFPEDHGPHPRFRTEWWYVTGNLSDEESAPVGFQFTLFRSALAPAEVDSPSNWATRQAYMAHLALTGPSGREFHAFERFARGANGLAGARADPFRVWLEDWVLEAADGAAAFPMRLRAFEGDTGLDLVLEAGKPLVLQGDDGLSRKGPEPGNASYYYSHTRMPTEGIFVLGSDTLAVSGSAWLDREWSTSVLSDGQVGWDWFALQLDGGWELMVYALRMADGSAHVLSEGVLVDPHGASRRLAWGEGVRVEVEGSWVSPRTGVRYPSGWRVTVPDQNWDLRVVPLRRDQELDLAFRYWEGAVQVERVDEPTESVGRGYVELTGYGEARLPGR